MGFHSVHLVDVGLRISGVKKLTLCPFVCVSVGVQNTSVCQSTDGGTKSHLVTALVIPPTTKWRGIYWNRHGCPSICLSVDSVLSGAFLLQFCIYCSEICT